MVIDIPKRYAEDCDSYCPFREGNKRCRLFGCELEINGSSDHLNIEACSPCARMYEAQKKKEGF